MLRELASLVLLVVSVLGDGVFHVEFNVNVQTGPASFVVEVHPEWAPLGAARFRELVEAGYYDDARFFRVIPGFMTQFGLAADPAVTAQWKQTINDEAVVQSNKPGYVTFAKTGAPNSRTTQLFINYGDNARLDGMGFAPFAVVLGNGLDIVKDIFPVGEKPSQGRITSEGNAYLNKEFPELSYIVSAAVVEPPPKVEL